MLPMLLPLLPLPLLPPNLAFSRSSRRDAVTR